MNWDDSEPRPGDTTPIKGLVVVVLMVTAIVAVIVDWLR